MHNYLPRKYHFISNFDKNHIDNQTSDTAIIFRNYTKKIDLDLILKIKNYCKKRKIKFLISNNIKLAINLNLDGAYIPSFNTSTRHLNYTRSNKFILVGSSHNLKEIRMKELQNVQAIFLSSLFKKNKNYLGVRKFKLLSCLTRIKIIALGGISNNNQKQLKLINCFGFAGISFFNK
ncbi:thiamine phosphate synthase [Candidatus Pelagibacter sp. Uisw_127]|uniref:thiamine phosphate synthase n=1 Tax=Candidatus Pelagibacter sp. Uisw_127 TaxID=3230988 RepID=UPI0039ED3D72